MNNQAVNSFSDGCPNSESPYFRCPRKVATVTCIHNLNYKLYSHPPSGCPSPALDVRILLFINY